MENIFDLKVGDRVVVERSEKLGNPAIKNGYAGTVVKVMKTVVGVNFDKCINGHNCDYTSKGGHGWYCFYEALELEGLSGTSLDDIDSEEMDSFIASLR